MSKIIIAAAFTALFATMPALADDASPTPQGKPSSSSNPVPGEKMDKMQPTTGTTGTGSMSSGSNGASTGNDGSAMSPKPNSSPTTTTGPSNN